EAAAIEDDGIKWREKAHRVFWLILCTAFHTVPFIRQIPINLVEMHARISVLCSLDSARQLIFPLRRSGAYATNKRYKAGARQWRINANGDINQRVKPGVA